MKISLNWLSDYISIDSNPERIGEILTDTGLEVEKIEKLESVKGGLSGVVIGFVKECIQHPDADRLKVTKVDIGTGEDLQIVCGAPNVGVGQKVVVATIGTTLHPSPNEEFKIKKSKIRGVDSEGMLCAEDELGLGASHDGILILPDDLAIGTPAATYFDLKDDYVFEIGLTPNRADAMGHIGVARDLAAYLSVHHEEKSIQFPEFIEPLAKEESDFIKIDVENPNDCPFYSGLVIKNVKVQPSPEWMQKRLRSVGVQPINNVVDCTNYVMLEYGNPLHAFNSAKLNGRIVVKNANVGDQLVTLDQVERKLHQDDSVITNGEEALCLAGVFGGLHSGVSSSTETIFLESAYFNPVTSRKMAKRHGLNTDASFRFERGVNPETTLCALHRCAQLIIGTTGGQIAMNTRIVDNQAPQKRQLVFSLKRCAQLIGSEIPAGKIEKILEKLDIQCLSKEGDIWTLSIPPYRVDVTREADVVEEILRIYGFNSVNIPETMNSSLPHFPKPNVEKLEIKIAELLAGMGFNELLNNSLVSSQLSEKLGGEKEKPENDVQLLNPLSQELNVMRRNLMFPVLQSIAFNQNRQQDTLRVFEFGKVYEKQESYLENKRLLMAIYGNQRKGNWLNSVEPTNFFQLKSFVQNVAAKLGMDKHLEFIPTTNEYLEDGLDILLFKEQLGSLGWPNAKILKHFGIKKSVFVADLNWDLLMKNQMKNNIRFSELPKTFAMRRDFSLLLDKNVSFKSLKDLAFKMDRKILVDVDLFDVYEGDKLPENKKSYAISFHFQDSEKSLTDQQVDMIMEKIRQTYEKEVLAELRA